MSEDQRRWLNSRCTLHQQQPLPEPFWWQRGRMGLLLRTNRRDDLNVFPTAPHVFIRSQIQVSPTALPHLILSDAHVYSCSIFATVCDCRTTAATSPHISKTRWAVCRRLPNTTAQKFFMSGFSAVNVWAKVNNTGSGRILLQSLLSNPHALWA